MTEPQRQDTMAMLSTHFGPMSIIEHQVGRGDLNDQRIL